MTGLGVPRPIRYEYTRPGKEVSVYPHILVHDEDDLKVLLMEDYSARDIVIDDQIVMTEGGSVVWHINPPAWYDVGLFYLPDGTFTGYYTNLVTPYESDGDDWRATDLFLDLWTDLDGNHQWLDEVEFTEARDAGLLTENQAIRVTGERMRIMSMMPSGEWPPARMKSITLGDARKVARE